MSIWPKRRLRDIGEWYGGGTPSKSQPEFWTAGSIPWLSPKDMGANVLESTINQITATAVAQSATRLVPKGSVALVVRSGILERKLPVASVPFETTLNQDMKAIVPGPEVDQRWLAWALRSQERVILRTCRKAGTTVASIEMSRLYDVTVPVPSVDEQRRIVDILEDHLSRLDAANTYLDAVSRKADLAQRGVLQAALSGQLSTPAAVTHDRARQLALRDALCPPEMKRGRPVPFPPAEGDNGWPNHWARLSLEEATHPVRTISYGILKPGANLDDGVPYVRVINMRKDVLKLADLHRTTREIAGQYARAALIPGDVLVSIRGTYGRVVMVPEALDGGNITQDTARLAFVGPIDPAFAAAYLRSPQAQGFLKRVARGVAVKGVNIGDLRTMPFPIPPWSEQQQIITRVSELSSEVDDARRTAESARARSASLRRALLDAAFSGRLTGRSSDMDVAEEMARA